MKKRSIRGFNNLLILMLFASAVACSGNEPASKVVKEDGVIKNPSAGFLQNEAAPVEFELLETIDLSEIEEPVISSIGYLQIDDAGNFYFIDRRINKLISLDPQGKLRWSTGQEGKGPGDFENPFGMSIHNDKLFVANIMGSRLDEFDLDGNFIKSYDLPKDIRFASLEGIRDDGLILMSGANFGMVGTLVYTMELTDSLRVKENINIIETEDEEYSRATIRGGIRMGDQDFIYSYNTRYAHQIYDYEGNLKLEVQRDFDGTVGPGIYADGGSVSLYSLGNISAPVFLDNGNYLVQVRYPTNIDDPHTYARRASTGETDDPIYEEFLDVYNAEHELLYTFDHSEFVEGLGSLNTRDAEGNYYSAFSDELVIKKYEVIGDLP